MNNPEITLKRSPGNWSRDTYEKMPIAQAIDKMHRLGYKAVSAKTRDVDAMRFVSFVNPNRKTTYTLIANLRDF